MSNLFVPLFSSLAYRKEMWSLTLDKLTDVSAGPVAYIDNNLELKTILAGSPPWVDGKLWQMGSWKEYCGYPTSPSSWAASATKQSTGIHQGAFEEVNVIDSGAEWNRVIIYNSIVNGNPTQSTQFCSVLYKIGTSPGGKVICRDTTLATESQLVYSGAAWSIAAQGAGGLSIYQNVEVFPGIRLLCFSITWTNFHNSISIGIGPNSTTGLNIVLYGATVNDIGFIWPLFNPTGGTTVLSRAGTIYCDLATAVNSKLKKALYGTDGTDAASKITFDWQPYYASSDVTASQTIFKTESKIIAFAAVSGNITLNDGTNTTSIALTSWAAKNTIKIEMICGDNHPDYPGVNKMQLCASKDNGDTWLISGIVDFDGSMINTGDTKFYYGGEPMMQAVSNVKAWNIKSGDWPT